MDVRLVTAGGRVLALVGLGADPGTARVSFDGVHYRRDIGRRLSRAMTNG